MLTILASYAQEESRSVSENCKWRIRQKFQQGIPVTTPLTGYRICKGEFTPVPEEAALVKMIFCDYADGLGRNAIQRKLPPWALAAALAANGRTPTCANCSEMRNTLAMY